MNNSFERFIGQMITFAIMLSWLIMLYGGILYLRHHGHEIIHDQLFSGEPSRFTLLPDIWKTALADMPRSIIQLGLVTVVAGQILRVFLTGILFAKQRDWAFVSMSFVILLILIHNAF